MAMIDTKNLTDLKDFCEKNKLNYRRFLSFIRYTRVTSVYRKGNMVLYDKIKLHNILPIFLETEKNKEICNELVNV